jgi:hypothetical protein
MAIEHKHILINAKINDPLETFDDAINAQIKAKQIADKKAAFNQLLRSNSSWVVG